MSFPSTSQSYGFGYDMEAHPFRTFFATFNAFQKPKVLPELHQTFPNNVIEIEPRRVEDSVHMAFGLKNDLTQHDMMEAKKMNNVVSIHYLLSQFTWNHDDSEDIPKFYRVIANTIVDSLDNINRFVEFIEINNKVLECESTKYLHIKVETASNTEVYRGFAQIIRNVVRDVIVKQSLSREMHWNVNGVGQHNEKHGSVTVSVHVTECSAFVGIEILGVKDFTSNMVHLKTGRFAMKLGEVIENTDIRPGMIVLDLNSVCGEMIIEVVKKYSYHCYCIGLFDDEGDARAARNNLETFLTLNNKNYNDVLVDFISAEMKEFINFSAVDRIFATYPHTNQTVEVDEAYFHRLVSILCRCRPNTCLLLQYPFNARNHGVAEAVERILKTEKRIKVRYEMVMEEFHKKTVLVLLERHTIGLG